MKKNALYISMVAFVLLAGILSLTVPGVSQVPQSLIVSPPVPAAVPTANKTGTGNLFATATAAGASGNCAQWTAAGDVGDAGAPCGSGGGVTSVAGLTGAVPGQGTDSKVLTAGTFSGSTGVTLCTDANGGATTSGCSGGGSGALVLVESHTASSSSALNFTSCFSSTYNDYMIRFVQLRNDTTDVTLELQVHGSGGYDTGTNYGWVNFGWVAGGTGQNGANSGQNFVALAQHWDSELSSSYNGQLNIFNPLPGTNVTQMTGLFSYYSHSNSTFEGITLNATYLQTVAVDGFRVLPSSGLLTSGTVLCYGLTH